MYGPPPARADSSVTFSTRSGARVRLSDANGSVLEEVYRQGGWAAAGHAVFLRWDPTTQLLLDQDMRGFEVDPGTHNALPGVLYRIKRIADWAGIPCDIPVGDPFVEEDYSMPRPYGGGREHATPSLASYVPAADGVGGVPLYDQPRPPRGGRGGYSGGGTTAAARRGYISRYGGADPHNDASEGSSIDAVSLSERLNTIGYQANGMPVGESYPPAPPTHYPRGGGYRGGGGYEEPHHPQGVSDDLLKGMRGEVSGYASIQRERARAGAGGYVSDDVSTSSVGHRADRPRQGRSKSRWGVDRIPREHVLPASPRGGYGGEPPAGARLSDYGVRSRSAARASPPRVPAAREPVAAPPAYRRSPSPHGSHDPSREALIEGEVRRRCAAYVEGLKEGLARSQGGGGSTGRGGGPPPLQPVPAYRRSPTHQRAAGISTGTGPPAGYYQSPPGTAAPPPHRSVSPGQQISPLRPRHAQDPGAPLAWTSPHDPAAAHYPAGAPARPAPYHQPGHVPAQVPAGAPPGGDRWFQDPGAGGGRWFR